MRSYKYLALMYFLPFRLHFCFSSQFLHSFFNNILQEANCQKASLQRRIGILSMDSFNAFNSLGHGNQRHRSTRELSLMEKCKIILINICQSTWGGWGSRVEPKMKLQGLIPTAGNSKGFFLCLTPKKRLPYTIQGTVRFDDCFPLVQEQ